MVVMVRGRGGAGAADVCIVVMSIVNCSLISVLLLLVIGRTTVVITRVVGNFTWAACLFLFW